MAINIIDGFSLKAKKHLDERSSFATKDEMLGFDPNSLAVGLITYCEEDETNYQWNGAEWVELGTAGGGAGGVWESEEGVATALGGIKAGDKLNGLNALEILDRALNPYMSPVINISINPATTLYEVGKTATISVNATLTKKTNEITSAKIFKDNAELKAASSNEISAKSFSQANINVTTDTTFSSKVADEKGEVSGNNIAIRFTRKGFYGVIGADETCDSATKIEALAQNQLTGSKGLSWNSYNANNGKVVYAYPKSFGDLTSIKDGNNFEMLSSFSKTEVTRDSVPYNVYTLNAPMSITNGKLIFS